MPPLTGRVRSLLARLGEDPARAEGLEHAELKELGNSLALRLARCEAETRQATRNEETAAALLMI